LKMLLPWFLFSEFKIAFSAQCSKIFMTRDYRAGIRAGIPGYILTDFFDFEFERLNNKAC
jgi:hypothetical protein